MAVTLHEILRSQCDRFNTKSKILSVSLSMKTNTPYADYRAYDARFNDSLYSILFYDLNSNLVGEISFIDCPKFKLNYLRAISLDDTSFHVITYSDFLYSDYVIVGYAHTCTENLAYKINMTKWFINTYKEILLNNKNLLIEVSGTVSLTDAQITNYDYKDIRKFAGNVASESETVFSLVKKFNMRKVVDAYESHTLGAIYVSN